MTITGAGGVQVIQARVQARVRAQVHLQVQVQVQVQVVAVAAAIGTDGRVDTIMIIFQNTTKHPKKLILMMIIITGLQVQDAGVC